MRPANLLIWIVIVLAIGFVILNWSTLGAAIPVSLGFTHLSVPLGLVLLGFTAVFLVLLLNLQIRLLATHRRHAAELRTQRELAENAEASRLTELRQYLQTELAALREEQRLSEQRLHEGLLSASNSLAASVGQLDERLEQHFPVPLDQRP